MNEAYWSKFWLPLRFLLERCNSGVAYMKHYRLYSTFAGALCGFASAQTITTTFTSSDPREIVNGTFDGGTTVNDKVSGVLNFNNVDFVAFCAEPLQNITPGQTIDYTVSPLTDLTNVTSVAKVITAFRASSMDNIQAAGAQWAIWELVGETAGAFDTDSGTIAITSPFIDTVDAQVRDAAKNYLVTFDNFAASDVTFLTNPTVQNMITWTAVPEPSSALLSGLGVLALIRRRR